MSPTLTSWSGWVGRLLVIGLAASLFKAGITTSPAQVVLDGKFGSGALAGPNYSITAGMGAVRGNNLFQSFSQFNLVAGDIATFSGPANIQNILARVTGGSASSIDGTIQSGIAGANFFFINPKGIIFGPNAAIDVTGAFAASTANYLKLADGAKFVASLGADDSGLSSAPVSAFGFLGSNPGSIVVQQSKLQNNKTISLVGGDITFDGGSAQSPGGQVNLVSVRSAGEVAVNPTTTSIAQFSSTFAQAGQISLRNGAQLDASGEGGGRIVIRGGSLTVDNSKIQANTTGSTDGKGIDVAVVNDLTLRNGGQITSVSTLGLGAGGDISLNAGTIRLDGGGLIDDTGYPSTQISTSTGDVFSGGGSGRGGNILINVGSLEMKNSAQISSASFGAGNAGRISINASSITLDAVMTTVVQISANTQANEGAGNAGDIVIHTGTMEMRNAATIFAAAFGDGRAGLVDITANTLNLFTASIITAATFGSGHGGDVKVNVGTLRIDGHDTSSGIDFLTGIQAVTTDLSSHAPGGNLQITADSIELDHMGSLFTTSYGAGPGGNIEISAGILSMANNSTIKASTEVAEGAAGVIDINAQSIRLRSGSLITASTIAAGSGGNIQINAGTLTISGQDTTGGGSDIPTGIEATTTSADSPAPGGKIQITADSLQLDHSGSISTTSFGLGAGGNIELSVGSLSLANDASIKAAAEGNGAAGLITLSAQSLDLRTGATISASTSGAGNGGNIQVSAGTIFISGQDTLTAGADIATGIEAVTRSSDSAAPGGNIQITAGSLALDHNGSISTTSFGPGTGGSIEVQAGTLTLANSASIRAAGESTGQAGTISIRADGDIRLRSNSEVSTSAPNSSGGDISVFAGHNIELENSQITAQAGLNGGNINVSANNLVYLLHSKLTAQADQTGSGFGNGGNITIDPSFLILNDSSLISKSSFGNGGNITILTDYFFQSQSIIDATAPFGLPGTVTVTAPNLDLSASLVSLPGNLLDVETLLRPDCGVRLSGNVSSFIVQGSGGLPVAPGGFVPSSTPAAPNGKE